MSDRERQLALLFVICCYCRFKGCLFIDPNEVEAAVEILHDGRVTARPFATVCIAYAKTIMQCGLMEVSADDPVVAARLRQMGQSLFKVIVLSDRGIGAADRPFDPEPFRLSKLSQNMPLGHVNAHCNTFNETAGPCQQRSPERKDVADVAMGHQIAAPIGRLMHDVPFDLDAAKTRADVVAEEVVMVAGNVDNPRTGSRQIEKPLQDLMMCGFPIARQRVPVVHDIADEIDRLSVVCPQEIEDQIGT